MQTQTIGRCVDASTSFRIGVRGALMPVRCLDVSRQSLVGRHEPEGFHPVHPNRRPGPRALAVALAILLVPVTAGAVSAAYGKPEITMYASVSGTPFVDVRVNRNPKQVVFGSCAYVLDSDAPTGCGWMLGSHISSHWTLVPNDLSVGDHMVTVTIDLTDHEQLTNSISFTVPAPPTGP
jgi:hypothetical protein